MTSEVVKENSAILLTVIFGNEGANNLIKDFDRGSQISMMLS
ncbi:4560_t:CDS:1, partial [Scutellospora calospora]